MSNTKSKRKNKKFARKKAIRTVNKETTQDSMRASRRNYGEGKGK